jgi:hypothetical protein
VSANRVALTAAAGSQAGTTEPGVDAATGGTLSRAGGCVTFRPDAVRDPVVAGDVQLTLPPAGLRLTTGAGAASLSLRRFAAGFPPQPLSRISPGSSAELSIPGDGAAAPWHVRIAPDAAVTACTGA